MENKVIYKQSSLAPRTLDSVSGSEYWSIEGRKVQFTWFTVPNNTKFPKHKHESEQVTYVLEGELFFKSENSVYKLSKGDCILIPENTEHEVWTEKESAKAVDAWSPVNKTYIQSKSMFLNK